METEKEMTAIQKTQVYLENYREIERYIKDAISEVSQIDDVSRYNISAEKAFLQSIRECKAETVILFEHMKKALASLKEDAEAAGEREHPTQHQSRATQRLMLHTDSTRALQEHTR